MATRSVGELKSITRGQWPAKISSIDLVSSTEVKIGVPEKLILGEYFQENMIPKVI